MINTENNDNDFKTEDNTYDLAAYYNKHIAPLVKEIRLHCYSAGIPMFMTFAVKNTDNDTEYVSEMNLASTHKILNDNKIAKLVLRLNDFEIKHPVAVRRAIKTLEAYLDSDGNMNGRILFDDKLDDMEKIALKDAGISLVDTFSIDDDEDIIETFPAQESTKEGCDKSEA